MESMLTSVILEYFSLKLTLKNLMKKSEDDLCKINKQQPKISFYEQIEFIFVRQLKSCFVNDSVYLWVTANSLLKKIGCERNFVLYL